jgi:predicted permease
VRLAVGASRRRVLAQLLTESMLIAILGGASGVLVALAAIPALLRFVPQSGREPVTGINATLDWRVLAFTVMVCVLTGLLFGIVPAWQSTRPDLVPSLKEDVPGSTGIRHFTLRKGLVILQIALSIPLLVGAGLFARTLGKLRGLDAGFTHENVLIASVDPTRFGYKGQRVRDFYDRLCARVAALPGVRSASLAFITPLTGASWNGNVTVEGYAPKSGEKNNVFFDAVGPRYFETLGTPVLLGREFTQRDNPVTTIELPDHIVFGQTLPDPPGGQVAIVNETFARHFFGDHSPLGMHVMMGGPFHSSYEIVGLAKDARYFGVRSAVEPMMFIPAWRNFTEQRELVIRTAGSASHVTALLRREIHEIDPVIPLLNVHTLEQDVDQSILVERLVATLSGFFGALALLLSAVGLYGVVAYTVTRRTREIGIRIALGAARGPVLWLVFRDVAIMIACGAIFGTVVAFMATRAIASILYGVRTTDPFSIAIAATSLVVAAVVASLIPARRAAKVDPIVALRYE